MKQNKKIGNNRKKLMMINKQNMKRIDVSNFPSGIYNMIITYDKMRWNKKIIKE